MNFELKNINHCAPLCAHDVRFKNNFLEWGHMHDSDAHSKCYTHFISHYTKLPLILGISHLNEKKKKKIATSLAIKSLSQTRIALFK